MSEEQLSTGIDRSIGLLLVGLAVAGFMMLTIFGMRNVEQRAERVSDGPRDEVPPPVIDFAD